MLGHNNVQAAMAAHCHQQLSRAQLMRAIAWYPTWLAPSEQAADGVSLRMMQNHEGAWWVLAFSDQAQFDHYAQQTPGPDQNIVVKGSSLLRNLPNGAVGLVFDMHAPHSVSFGSSELMLLQQYGHAFEVEGVLAGTSTRDNQPQLLQNYDGYRVLRHRPSGQHAFAAGPQGQSGLAVFTTECALVAFMQNSPLAHDPNTELRVLGGRELFTQLAPTMPGLVFNAAGPQPFTMAPPMVAHVGAAPAPDFDADAFVQALAEAGALGPPGLFNQPDYAPKITHDPPLAEPRPHFMAMGRELLPQLLAADPAGFVQKLRGPDRVGLLLSTWMRACDKNQKGGRDSQGLSVAGVEDIDGHTLLVIQLPQARAMLEGHMAALVVGPTGGRYFLLERSTDDIEGALVDRTVGSRANLGFIPVKLEAFARAVCAKIGLVAPPEQSAAPREAARSGGVGGLFDGARQPLKQKAQDPPADQPRMDHMVVCREMLPELLHRDPAAMLGRLCQPGADAWLSSLWLEGAQRAAVTPSPSLGLSVVGVEERGGATLVVVQFPQARVMLEGIFAAFYNGPSGPRYFLMERSFDDIEAALVARDGSGGRSNLGYVKVDVDAFIADVRQRVGM